MSETWTLRANVGQPPVLSADGAWVEPDELPLSPRLLDAIADWRCFFDEVSGDLSSPEVAEEFVGQGYKIAHAMRRELKGRTIYFCQPVTKELVKIG